MTTGLVLIAAILVLGGVIATVGDRLGMKVGKARLSLFRLRPRQTATLITVLTGIIISASTFGILFAIDDQLRTGVFELGEIQEDLESARGELEQARNERRQTRQDLRQALREQRQAERRLGNINQSLEEAIAQREETQIQLSKLQDDYRQAQQLLRSVSQQASQLRSEIQQLERDRQQQLAQRDREIAQRDREIAQRNEAIAERERQLQELENQQAFLTAEIQALEREFQGLRLGSVALFRNQTLAAGVVRIVNPSAAPQAVDRLLRAANQVAVQRILPQASNFDTQIIQITTSQVEGLVTQIRDGQDYVVRILSAGNYVENEPCVLAGEVCILVYASAIPNEQIFRAREVIASTFVNPQNMNEERIEERIRFVIAAAQFRVRQLGVLDETVQIADGSIETINQFFAQIRQYNQSLEIQAISAEDAFTAGPVRIELVAVENGQVVFSTSSLQ